MTAHRITTHIRPPTRFAALDPRELWQFRDLFLAFAGRDVRLRYRQTLLGASWVVLQPLLGAAIFAFVFGRVAGLSSEGTPYLVFAFAGLTVWNVFSTTVTRASGSLIANAGMISKIYFPRALLPLSVSAAAALDALVSLAVLGAMLALSGVHVGFAALLFPLWMAVAALCGLGVGLGLSALAVRYRDVQYIVPVATQLLLFITPVAYGTNSIPESARTFVELNPMTGVLEGFRWSVLGGATPSALAVGTALIGASILLIVGFLVFKAMESNFADVI